MKLKRFTPAKFRRRVFSQLWMLALQFALGMGLNLLGTDTSGAAHIVYSMVLILHIVNAIGLVEGGVYIALKERSRLSWWAAIAVGITFCAGVCTVLTQRDIWSFVMACGFLATAWLNVTLYVCADRALRSAAASHRNIG